MNPMDFHLSDEWRRAYPGAAVGLLDMSLVRNPERHPALDERCRQLEEALRQRYAGWDRAALKADPVLAAYGDYYRRFGKTYHILLQLESVVFKGAAVAGAGALVQAMFMTELDHLLLTAGHDRGVVQDPVGVHLARGDEVYTRLDGRQQSLKAGDMYIADGEGVISSIIYGPDGRTRLGPTTDHVLYTAYAPPGVPLDRVHEHLTGLEALVRLVAPEAVTIERGVHAAA